MKDTTKNIFGECEECLDIKQMSDVQETHDTIYRLGHTMTSPPSNEPGMKGRPNYGFEIGFWEPVPVEKKKCRRMRVPREEIDYEKIDYDSHLHTPRIEDMKRPKIPERRVVPEIPEDPAIAEYMRKEPKCLCYVCLIKLSWQPELGRKIAHLVMRKKYEQLREVASQSKQFFKQLFHVIEQNDLPMPTDVPSLNDGYRKMLEFFEQRCRPETIDIAIVLNEQFVSGKPQKLHLKNLHEVFRAIVYASASKILYQALCFYWPVEKICSRKVLDMKRSTKITTDPYDFTALPRHDDTNLEKNFMNLYRV